MDFKVTIMVGVPGSGKTHYIKTIKGAFSVSADDFFAENGNGVYAFDPSMIGEAHGQCLRRYVTALQRAESHVVVDNTNTTVIELAPYVALALAGGYSVEIVRMICDPTIAAARNIHGVPERTVRAMHDRIEAMFATGLPPFWEVTVRTV